MSSLFLSKLTTQCFHSTLFLELQNETMVSFGTLCIFCPAGQVNLQDAKPFNTQAPWVNIPVMMARLPTPVDLCIGNITQ